MTKGQRNDALTRTMMEDAIINKFEPIIEQNTSRENQSIFFNLWSYEIQYQTEKYARKKRSKVTKKKGEVIDPGGRRGRENL